MYIYILAFLQEIRGFSLLFTLSRDSRDSRELKNQFPTFPGMKKSRETANSKSIELEKLTCCPLLPMALKILLRRLPWDFGEQGGCCTNYHHWWATETIIHPYTSFSILGSQKISLIFTHIDSRREVMFFACFWWYFLSWSNFVERDFDHHPRLNYSHCARRGGNSVAASFLTFRDWIIFRSIRGATATR